MTSAYNITQDNELKQKAIDHYNRMIEWVKTRPQEEKPTRLPMVAAIGEDWSSKYCAYCSFLPSCTICPLDQSTNDQDNCCGNLWHKLNISKTWKEWLLYAELIKIFIDENG